MSRRGDSFNPITGRGYDDTPSYGRRARPGSGTGPSVSPIVMDDSRDAGRGPPPRGVGSASSVRSGSGPVYAPAPGPRATSGASKRDQVWEEKRRAFLERKAAEEGGYGSRAPVRPAPYEAR